MVVVTLVYTLVMVVACREELLVGRGYPVPSALVPAGQGEQRGERAVQCRHHEAHAEVCLWSDKAQGHHEYAETFLL